VINAHNHLIKYALDAGHRITVWNGGDEAEVRFMKEPDLTINAVELIEGTTPLIFETGEPMEHRPPEIVANPVRARLAAENGIQILTQNTQKED